MKRVLLGVALCLLLGTPPASAAVFQYAVPVATSKGESVAFLWIPAAAPRVRGAILSGMTLMEREMAKDACVREACAGEGLAIVFVKCGLGSIDVQRVLDDLADVSGYGELSTAPLMFVGHSAGGPQAKALAGRMHARCFGLVQYRGGSPGGDDPLPPGVPALMMVGQFDVHPVFADEYPSQYNGHEPRWLEADKHVGHGTAPIRVEQVSGPVVAVGPNTLRMQYDALAPATESSRVTFMAYSDGDDRYRYTEHVGMMPRGFKGLTKGKEQTITFPVPEKIRAGGNPVALRATSDSGLPVEYHIAYGPAIISEGRLQATEIPVRAVYPIPVKVVAYQFGSGVEPLIKTAAPVERTVLIENP